jgi:hypothetical protein
MNRQVVSENNILDVLTYISLGIECRVEIYDSIRSHETTFLSIQVNHVRLIYFISRPFC